jgi:protease II
MRRQGWKIRRRAQHRSERQHQRPILLQVDFDEGQGFGSSRPQRESMLADQFSFVLWQSGDPEFQPGKASVKP